MRGKDTKKGLLSQQDYPACQANADISCLVNPPCPSLWDNLHKKPPAGVFLPGVTGSAYAVLFCVGIASPYTRPFRVIFTTKALRFLCVGFPFQER